jgi:hypothetical protein
MTFTLNANLQKALSPIKVRHRDSLFPNWLLRSGILQGFQSFYSSSRGYRGSLPGLPFFQNYLLNLPSSQCFSSLELLLFAPNITTGFATAGHFGKILVANIAHRHPEHNCAPAVQGSLVYWPTSALLGMADFVVRRIFHKFFRAMSAPSLPQVGFSRAQLGPAFLLRDLSLSHIDPPTSASPGHSLWYTAVHFYCSFPKPVSLVVDLLCTQSPPCWKWAIQKLKILFAALILSIRDIPALPLGITPIQYL